MTIQYGILLKLRDAVSGGLGKINKRIDAFGKRIEGVSRTARRGLLGLAGAFGAVTYASMEQEKADRALSEALKATGQYTDANYESLRAMAGELQNVTIYGDEFIQNLQAQALNLGIQHDQLGEVTRGAIGLATALDMDLKTALRYTALAMQGEYTMLQRYIPELRTAETEAEKLAIVQRMMAQGFEQAKGRAETLSGRLAQLKNRFGDLLQAVGQAIFGTENWGDTIKEVEGKIKGAIEWVKNLTDEQKQQIVTLAKWGLGIIAVTAALGPLTTAVKTFVSTLKFLTTPLFRNALALAVIAGSLLLVTDALGLTDIGIERSIRKWERLDAVMTRMSEGWRKLAGGAKRTASWIVEQNRRMAAEMEEAPPRGLLPFRALEGREERAAGLRRQIREAQVWRAESRRADAQWTAEQWRQFGERHPSPGAKPDKLTTQRAKVAGQVQNLQEALVPLLEAVIEDQEITKDELKDLTETVNQLSKGRRG